MDEIILHINTALDKAYVALSAGEQIIAARESQQQKDHAAFLQPAIRDMLAGSGNKVRDLRAISVVNGPGSYTGLRVGLSAAKGLCYASGIPLVCISTLEWLAMPHLNTGYDLIVPMIDARRMEVFTAAFNNSLQSVLSAGALILDEHSYADILPDNKTIFTGNGAGKLPQSILDRHQAVITEGSATPADQVKLTLPRVHREEFADLAYTEPYYLKAFHTHTAI